MKKIAFLFAALATIALTASCTPEPPIPPDCQANGWAYISFENKSKTNKSYVVILDGVELSPSLKPGQTTAARTVSKGYHTIAFRFHNSTTIACRSTAVNLAQCTTNVYFCKE